MPAPIFNPNLKPLLHTVAKWQHAIYLDLFIYLFFSFSFVEHLKKTYCTFPSKWILVATMIYLDEVHTVIAPLIKTITTTTKTSLISQ